MRSKTESRRCGCGAILSLRESCPRCAAAERARLHAAGVAYCEEARYQPDAGTFANPAVKQPELTLERIQDAYEKCFAPGWGERLRKSQNDPRTKAGSSPLSQACAAAEEARRLTGVVPYAVGTRARPESPVVYWCTPLKRDWFVKPPSNVPPTPERPNSCNWLHAWGYGGDGCVKFSSGGGWCWTWRVVDGVIVFDEAERMVREHGPEFRRVYLGTREDGSPVYTNARGMPSRTPEPPPVGAEVEYAVAESDMRRRQEARYTCGRYPGNSYCHREEGLRVDWKNGQEFIEPYHLNIEGDRWTRLPDATTVPEIGVEVSWEVAKADMMARSEARYDYRVLRMTAVGVEYALIGGRLVTRGNGKAWEASILSEAECADPERRWVRLA